MTSQGLFRHAAWAVAAVFAVATASLLFVDRAPRIETTGTADVGGSFRLTAHDGTVVDSEGLKGKPVAVFFGFTHCPDVCPTTLADLTGYLRELGPEADRLQVLFVSVDPERDTRDVLAEYMQAFDPRILALTGTPAEIDAVVKGYKAFYGRVPGEGGGYTLMHTSSVYLMDRRGVFAGTIPMGEAHGAAMGKLRTLLRS